MRHVLAAWGRVDVEERRRFVGSLLHDSRANLAFVVLLVSSCTIATLGLVENSAAVIIGAMIIAPLLAPIQGLAFGALEGQVSLFRRSLVTLAIGTAVSIVISYTLGMLIGVPTLGSEVIIRSRPTILDLGIAIAAGVVGGFARVRADLSGTVAGTAIAVALMPPLCVIGLGLAHEQPTMSLGAAVLFATNLLGIVLACMVVFLVSGYTTPKRARTALAWTLLLTALLVVPLAASLVRLVREARLEHALESALLNRTVTFQRVELVNARFNWLTTPPTVNLLVLSREPITPVEVGLIEDFAKRETGQRFRLVFEVSRVEAVTREGARTPATIVVPQ
ncbi:MAG TPA: DUF389 domain-containing protein [Candidatus Dormibacteraeota bacterium]|nr:DUF389 domain-containing protein [Candidatus Dormibacteraeota bacterium]